MRDQIGLLLLFTMLAMVSSRLRTARQGDQELEDMNIKMLRMSVPGEPGQDYPILATVPETSFSCAGKAEGGYYADVETGCQVVHTCGGGTTVVNKFSFIKYSTLCANGTIYSQEVGTCHWWYLVDCESSEKFYFTENNIRESQSSSSSSSSTSSSSSSSSSSLPSLSSSSSSSFEESSGGSNGGSNSNSGGSSGGSSSNSGGAASVSTQGLPGLSGQSGQSFIDTFNSQSSSSGNNRPTLTLTPVDTLPPVRFPGGGFGQIQSNNIQSSSSSGSAQNSIGGTTEIAFFSADDFDFDLSDFFDTEAPQALTSTRRSTTPGFFVNRGKAQEISFQNGNLKVLRPEVKATSNRDQNRLRRNNIRRN